MKHNVLKSILGFCCLFFSFLQSVAQSPLVPQVSYPVTASWISKQPIQALSPTISGSAVIGIKDRVTELNPIDALGMVSDSKTGTSYVITNTGILKRTSNGTVTVFSSFLTRAIALDNAANVYAAISAGVYRIDDAGIATLQFPIVSGDISFGVKSMAIDGNQNVYILDSDTSSASVSTRGRVLKYNSTGTLLSVIGNNSITSMGLSPNGNLYTCTYSGTLNNSFTKIAPNGTSTVITGSCPRNNAVPFPFDGPMNCATFVRIKAMVIDSSENIYLAETSGRIRKIDQLKGQVTSLKTSVMANGLGFDVDGNLLGTKASSFFRYNLFGFSSLKELPEGLSITVDGIVYGTPLDDAGKLHVGVIASNKFGSDTAFIDCKISCSAATFNPFPDLIKSTGTPVDLDPGNSFSKYYWNTGDSLPQIRVNSSGWYNVRVTFPSGCRDVDSVYVSLINASVLFRDTVICKGAAVDLGIRSLGYPQRNYSLFHKATAYDMNELLSGRYNFYLSNPRTVDAPGEYVKFPLYTSNYNEWTLEFWTKPVSMQNSTLLGMGAPLDDRLQGFAFHPNKFMFKVQGSRDSVLYSGNNLKWNHYAVTFGSDGYKIFLNGQLKDTKLGPNLDPTWLSPALPLMTNTYWQFFTKLDGTPIEVGTHDLSAYYDDIRFSKVRRYVGDFKPENNWIPDSSTIGYWNFNEGYGDVAYDLSGNANHGQVLGPSYDIDVPVFQSLKSTYRYLWSTGDTTSTVKVSPTKTTTYYVDITDGFGTKRDSVVVHVSGLENVFQDSTHLLQCNSLLETGYGFTSVRWSNGDTGTHTILQKDGSVWFEGLNRDGCKVSDTTYVNLLKLDIFQKDSTVCKGSLVQLSVDVSVFLKYRTPQYVYSWSTGAITASIYVTPQVSKVYYVSVTDGVSYCVDSVRVNVFQLDTSISNLDQSQICQGSGSARLKAGSASAYQWLKNGLPISGANAQLLTVTEAGDYRVIISNLQDCLDTSRIITINQLPPSVAGTVTANVTQLCIGTNSVQLSVSGYVGALQWQSSIDQTNFVPIQGGTGMTLNVSNLPVTTYFRVVATNGLCAPAVSNPFKITVNPRPRADFNVSDSIQCQLGNSFVFANTSVISSGTLNYEWSFGDNDLSSIQNPVHNYVKAQRYVVKLKVYSNEGCRDSSSRSVLVNPSPAQLVPSPIGDTSFCEGGSVFLLGDQTFQNQWFRNGVQLSDTAKTFKAIAGGLYQLKVTNGFGCQSLLGRGVQVTAFPIPGLPVISGSASVVVCLGTKLQPLQATGTVGHTLLWYFSATGDTGRLQAPVPKTEQVGTSFYFVSQRSAFGCESGKSKITVTVGAQAKKPVLRWDGVFLQTDTGFLKYEWFGDGKLTEQGTLPSYRPKLAASYRVRVTNNAGCIDSSEVYQLVVTALESQVPRASWVSLYPNPVENRLVVELIGLTGEVTHMRLFDAKGAMIREWKSREKKAVLETSGLINGQYMLEIVSGVKRSVQKIIKH